MQGRRSNHEGSIYQTSNGRWIGEITFRARRRRVSGSTKRDVSQKLRRLRTELEDGLNPSSDKVTLRSVMNRVIDSGLPRQSGKDVATSTLETERWAATLWANSTSARMHLVDLRAEHVEASYRSMRSRTGKVLGQRTLKLVRSVLLRAIRDELARTGDSRIQVTLNAASAARFPANTPPPGSKQALTESEARALLDVLDTVPNGLMFAFSLVMGLRPGEAAGLRRSSLDPELRLLFVETSRRRTPHGVEVTPGLKTRTSRRTLSIPQSIRRSLKEHIAVLDEAATRQPPQTDLLFSTATGAPIDPSNARRLLARACEQARVPVVAPNELRHSAATLLAREFPLHHVAQILGHSVEVTDAYYWHRDRDVAEDHLRLFD